MKSGAVTLFQLHYCWTTRIDEQIYKIFRHQEKHFLSIQSEQSQSGFSVRLMTLNDSSGWIPFIFVF